MGDVISKIFDYGADFVALVTRYLPGAAGALISTAVALLKLVRSVFESPAKVPKPIPDDIVDFATDNCKKHSDLHLTHFHD